MICIGCKYLEADARMLPCSECRGERFVPKEENQTKEGDKVDEGNNSINANR